MVLAGLILVCLPLLAPVLFSLMSLISSGMFRFDYLMPAELAPVWFLGGCLLLWSAFRTRRHLRLIGFSFLSAILTLAASQVVAVLTGLASGNTAPAGLPWFTVIFFFILFWLSLLLLAFAALQEYGKAR